MKPNLFDEHKDNSELKRKFAKLCLTLDPFDAARAIFPTNQGAAMKCHNEWVQDWEVQGYIDQLKVDNGTDDTPNEIAAAKRAWKTFEKFDAANDPTSAKYFKMYCDIKGYFKKAESIGDNDDQESKVRADLFEKKKFEKGWRSS